MCFGSGKPAPDLAACAFGPFTVQTCASLDEAAQALRDKSHDALLLHLGTPGHCAP